MTAKNGLLFTDICVSVTVIVPEIAHSKSKRVYRIQRHSKQFALYCTSHHGVVILLQASQLKVLSSKLYKNTTGI